MAALVGFAALAGCESNSGAIPTPDETDGAPVDRTLSFAVFGPEEEIAAYQSLIAVYNSLYDGAEMEFEGYSSRESLMGTIRESGEVPDVFLTSGKDLAWLQEQALVQPVDSLLIERGLDFGDLYSRDAVLAFSSDNRLQCMPVGISPMVLFYNTELVDFERMALRGLPVPGGEQNNWDFEQFSAAAEFATRPRRGTRAIHVQPTVEGLAPFVYAGGGEVYNDAVTPTSLAFSSDDSRSALEQALTVLRDPRLTLSDVDLEKHSALEWFKRGKLAMIPGYRELVPQLRQVTGLQFDVISMPAIERNATVGTMTGMCVSAATGNTIAAADFLVHMASSVSVRRVATEGYLVPANLEVAPVTRLPPAGARPRPRPGVRQRGPHHRAAAADRRRAGARAGRLREPQRAADRADPHRPRSPHRSDRPGVAGRARPGGAGRGGVRGGPGDREPLTRGPWVRRDRSRRPRRRRAQRPGSPR